MPSDLQISFPEDINISNIRFDEPVKKSFADNVDYWSSNIKIRYANGAIGDLVIQLPECPSWGISDKYAMVPGKAEAAVEKVSLSITLGEKDNFDGEYKTAIKAIEDVVKAVKKFILSDDVKNKIGKYDLEENDLKGISPLKYKRDPMTKKLRFDLPPSLYVKFMTKFVGDKDNKYKIVETKFYDENVLDENGEPSVAEWQTFLNQQGYCTPVIKVEKIHFGKDISLMFKVYQVDYRMNNTSYRSLIDRSRKRGFKKENMEEEPADEGDNQEAADEDEEVFDERPALIDEEEEPVRSPSPVIQSPVLKQEPPKTIRRGTKKN